MNSVTRMGTCEPMNRNNIEQYAPFSLYLFIDDLL